MEEPVKEPVEQPGEEPVADWYTVAFRKGPPKKATVREPVKEPDPVPVKPLEIELAEEPVKEPAKEADPVPVKHPVKKPARELVKVFAGKDTYRDLPYYLNASWSVGLLVLAGSYYLWKLDLRLASLLAGAVFLVMFLWALFLHTRFQARRFRTLQHVIRKGRWTAEFPEFDRKSAPWNAEILIDDFMARFLEMVRMYEKERVTSRHTLEKYLGSRGAKYALQSSDYSLGGHLQKVIVVFSDIRGFTSMAEKLKPQETMHLLNNLFTSLETVITQYGGEINKYIGDAILAYFTTSEGREQSLACRVVEMCMKMKDKFEDTCRQPEFTQHHLDIGIGIGVIMGPAILGNLGSRQRMEFTLIGDTVNLASRVCSIAASGEILLNEELGMLVSEKYYIETLPPVQLKGKSELIVPYSVMGKIRG